VAVGLVKNAPHRAAALTVLNYLLSPEGNANTGASWGLPTNPAAFQLLDSSLKAKLQPLTTVAYVVPDWDYIASNMSTWREMWASTVLGS
jgi:2-aminoethylphosphonate transport system substrate-binding protein